MAVFEHKHVIIQNGNSNPKCARVRVEVENYIGKYLYVEKKQVLKIHGELTGDEIKCPYCKGKV